MQQTKIWVDGGSKNNGTPNAQAYGSYLIGESEIVRLKFGLGTNNEAEYRILLAALENVADNSKPIVMTDSQLVVNQVAGNWKVKSAKLSGLHIAAHRAVDRTQAELIHIPREDIELILGH